MKKRYALLTLVIVAVGSPSLILAIEGEMPSTSSGTFSQEVLQRLQEISVEELQQANQNHQQLVWLEPKMDGDIPLDGFRRCIQDIAGLKIKGVSLPHISFFVEETLARLVPLFENGTLNLEGLNLKHAPACLAQLKRILSLNLSGNQLTTLPLSLKDMVFLNSLNLANNQFTTLPDVVGELQGVRSLDLSNNQLTTLPLSLTGMVFLNFLNLANNQFTTLPDVIGEMPRLVTVVVYGNRLTVPWRSLLFGLFKRDYLYPAFYRKSTKRPDLRGYPVYLTLFWNNIVTGVSHRGSQIWSLCGGKTRKSHD